MPPDTGGLQKLVRKLWEVKVRRADAEKEWYDTERDAIDEFETQGLNDIEVDDLHAVVVRGERVLIDEDKLLERVGPRMADKLTKKVLDRRKLEAAVALGEVPSELLDECSEVKANKAFVRITPRGSTPPVWAVRTASGRVIKRRVRKPAKKQAS